MIVKDLFARFRSGITNLFKSRQQKTYEALDSGMDIFMAKVRQCQPKGKLDPLVLAGLSDRDERPSVRQGHKPIEQGWDWSVYKVDRGAEATVGTVSPHIKFFTRWVTGGQLGAGTHLVPKTPKKRGYLHFWWRGAEHKWKQSRVGFVVQEDFMQKAYNESKGQMSDIARSKIRDMIVESRMEL